MRNPKGPQTKSEEFFLKLLAEEENPHLLDDNDLKSIDGKVIKKFSGGINQVRRRELRTFQENEMITDLRHQQVKNGEEMGKAAEMNGETITSLTTKLKNKEKALEEKEKRIKEYSEALRTANKDAEYCRKEFENEQKEWVKNVRGLRANLDECVKKRDGLETDYRELTKKNTSDLEHKEREITTNTLNWMQKYGFLSHRYRVSVAVSSVLLGLVILAMVVLQFYHALFPILNSDFKKTFIWMLPPTVLMVFSIYSYQLVHGLVNKVKLIVIPILGFGIIYYFLLRVLMFYDLFALSWNYFTILALWWNVAVLLVSCLPLILI